VVPAVRLAQFLPDTNKISQGLIAGQPGWELAIETNKRVFAAEFVSRSRFVLSYPASLTPAQFIDALNANAGSVLSQSERDGLASDLASGTKTRPQLLLSVADNDLLRRQEFNRAFVLLLYFGYLRRNPDEVPDTDFSGYDFWLRKLNQFGGNFIEAGMVKAFVTSDEYKRRFAT